MEMIFGMEVKLLPTSEKEGEDFVFVDERLSKKTVFFKRSDRLGAAAAFKMNKEFKAGWIKELRSGKYQQGRGALHRVIPPEGDFFCCLGIYCELRKVPKTDKPVTHLYSRAVFYYGESLNLPEHLIPEVGGRAYQNALAACNDSGWSFDEIATLLEVAF